RHTRSKRDWSSDVCSSDLLPALAGLVVGALIGYVLATSTHRASTWDTRVTLPLVLAAGAAHLALIPAVEAQRQLLFGLYFAAVRSEERRVGKEVGSRWSGD